MNIYRYTCIDVNQPQAAGISLTKFHIKYFNEQIIYQYEANKRFR